MHDQQAAGFEAVVGLGQDGLDLAAGLFVGLTLAGAAPWVAAAIATAAGFTLRGLAITRGLSLPAYKD